jgi:hypothetical protein
LRLQRGEWIPEATGVSAHLRALWVDERGADAGGSDARGECVAVGARGTILRREAGGKWRRDRSGFGDDLHGVWGSGPTDVFAVGRRGTIAHFDGSRWTRRAVGGRAHLFDVWGTGPDHVVVVGGHGLVLRYDGRRWAAEPTPSRATLRGVWGSGKNDVYAVGDGVVLHDAGQGWQIVQDERDISLRRVFGRSAREVYAVGGPGAVLRFDGTTWHRERSGMAGFIRGGVTDAGGRVFIAGAEGAILSKRIQ